MKKILILSFVLSLFTGCTKSVLDDPKPTDGVSSEVVFGSREGVEALLSGIHRLSRDQYIRTDAGGLYSYYMARNVKGNDLIQRATWFLYDYENDNREPDYTRTRFSWSFAYEVINNTNLLIQGVENSSLSELDKKELIAQGKVIRAFYYFQLALEFQATYTIAKDKLSLPIYTEPATGDSQGNALSTLEEVYDLIKADLEESIPNLTESRIDKSYVNKAVANAIYTRVLLVTQDNWLKAEEAARAAYGGSVAASLSPETYANGFDNIDNPEWIWGMYQTADQSNYFYGPAAFLDHRQDGYYGTFVNLDFVNLFSDTDVRNTFANPYGIAPEDEATDYRARVTNKFNFAFDSDMVIVRTAEMILSEAEAMYHNGKEAEAHELLFELQSNRDMNAVKSSNTGNDLLEEIYLERRKELYAENGIEWFDAKRLRKGMIRTGNHRLMGPYNSLKADDAGFYLKIPQVEIDANPNIDESVNNGKER